MVVAHNPENGETMTDYIAIASFPTTAQSYEAFSKLTAQADRLGIVSGAIVEVDDSGHVSIPEASDSASSFDFGTGSVIGLVIGALAGPIGMLLGCGRARRIHRRPGACGCARVRAVRGGLAHGSGIECRCPSDH